MNRYAILSQIATRKTAANAYIFSGNAGAFLSKASRYFAQALNCENSQSPPCGFCKSCLSIAHHTALSYREWQPTTQKITIDLIRQIQEEVKYSPLQGYRVVAIRFAELLTLEAANAFLKTLEEPPPRICFVLLSRQPWSVLPTIQSRCQHLTFPIFSDSEIMRMLEEDFPAQKAEILEQCAQVPELIAYYLEQEGPLPAAYQSIQHLKSLSLIDRLALAQEMAQDKNQAKLILGVWLKELWKLFWQGAQEEKKNIDLVIENISQMKYNLNLRLHLETLFISII